MLEFKNLEGDINYLIYYISVLKIPFEDKLNPIVYKVTGKPFKVVKVKTDASDSTNMT